MYDIHLLYMFVLLICHFCCRCYQSSNDFNSCATCTNCAMLQTRFVDFFSLENNYFISRPITVNILRYKKKTKRNEMRNSSVREMLSRLGFYDNLFLIIIFPWHYYDVCAFFFLSKITPFFRFAMFVLCQLSSHYTLQ